MAPIVDGFAASHGVVRTDHTVAGVPIVEVRPSEILDERPVLYIHGGAYCFGSAYDLTAVQLATSLRRRVLSIDYDLAPESVFPVAVDQCIAVYRALASHGAPAVLAGISAGGGLALALMQQVLADTMPPPDRLLLLTPWSDLTGHGDSYVGNEGRDPLVRWKGLLDKAAARYAADADPRHPWLSSVNAEWPAPLPPTLVVTGTRDLFLSNCVRTYWHLRATGTQVELRVWEGMWHAFFADLALPETDEVYSEIATFCEVPAI